MPEKKIKLKLKTVRRIMYAGYLLAAVCSLSPGLLYALCRRLDLNG